jgi:Fe-S cluster assembly ATPase SufC
MNGKLVRSGTMELAKELEKKGYSWIEEELAEAG